MSELDLYMCRHSTKALYCRNFRNRVSSYEQITVLQKRVYEKTMFRENSLQSLNNNSLLKNRGFHKL